MGRLERLQSGLVTAAGHDARALGHEPLHKGPADPGVTAGDQHDPVAIADAFRGREDLLGRSPARPGPLASVPFSGHQEILHFRYELDSEERCGWTETMTIRRSPYFLRMFPDGV